MSNKLFKLMVFVVLVIATATATAVLASETGNSYPYLKGNGALQVFDAEGFKATPTWVKIWLFILISTFIVGLYFSIKHSLARWAVAGLILSAGLGKLIFSLLGLPYLGGSIAILHIVFWLPALLLLLIKRPFLNAAEPKGFRIWSGIMTFVIMFSFVFDIKDAIIYIRHVMSLG